MRRIEASGLNAWFGAAHVLKDVNVVAEPKTVTAIIGPSGCGKSTLVRCMNRMHEEVQGARVEGKVLFDGQDIYGQWIRSRCDGGSAWSSNARTRSPR